MCCMVCVCVVSVLYVVCCLCVCVRACSFELFLNEKGRGNDRKYLNTSMSLLILHSRQSELSLSISHDHHECLSENIDYPRDGEGYFSQTIVMYTEILSHFCLHMSVKIKPPVLYTLPPLT